MPYKPELPLTTTDEIECCQEVLNFLVRTDRDWNVAYGFHKGYEHLFACIQKHDMGDMISFTKEMNKKYRIYPDPLWSGSAKEFFAVEYGRNFFRIMIRQLKIKEIESSLHN